VVGVLVAREQRSTEECVTVEQITGIIVGSFSPYSHNDLFLKGTVSRDRSGFC